MKPTLVRPSEPIADPTAPDEKEGLESDSSGGAGSDDDDDDDDDKGKEARTREFAASKARYAASRPGHIPDGLGVVIVNKKYERDNELRMMLSCLVFYSVKSNCVYAGKTATLANDYESRLDAPYMTEDSRCLYSYLPRGFPMNPHEVTQGVRFINDSKELPIDHVEAYRLVAEFHRIAGGFVPELRDLAMQEILKDEVYLHKVRRPHANNHQLSPFSPLMIKR